MFGFLTLFVTVLKFLIISSFNLCFVSEVLWDTRTCDRGLEPRLLLLTPLSLPRTSFQLLSSQESLPPSVQGPRYREGNKMGQAYTPVLPLSRAGPQALAKDCICPLSITVPEEVQH